jgi:excisionase family DNA binding protein
MSNLPKEFLSADEAAEYLHLNKNHLYILAREGVIPCIRPFARKVLFSLEDLRNYLLSHRCQTDQEILDGLK